MLPGGNSPSSPPPPPRARTSRQPHLCENLPPLSRLPCFCVFMLPDRASDSASCIFNLVFGIRGSHRRHNKTGLDMIPHRAFWAALPGLIKDGFKLTFSKCGAGSQGGLGKFATSFAPYESL